MTFTGNIGSSNSRLGNLVLGLGAGRGRRYARPSSTPLYRVLIYNASNNYGGAVEQIAEFDRIHSLAYADYANSVPEAFFTVRQDDPKVAKLRDKGGRAHVWILRGNDHVWSGRVSLERDANSDDTIFYCYGHLADTFWTSTGWGDTFTSQTVGQIVTSAWERAKALTFSRVAHVQTGTIESPYTTLGGGVPITLPIYKAYHKRVLFLLQEMAAIGASDTGQASIFEITPTPVPVFNFWRDRSADLTDVRWEWGSGKVQGFREYEMPVHHRNVVFGIGQNPRNAVMRKEEADGFDLADWGRMEEPLFFSWVRDETELTRVLKLRMAKGRAHDRQLTLSMFPGSEAPPHSAEGRWRIGDTVPIKIDRGSTFYDGRQQISGYMVYVEDGQEYIRPIVQESL